MATKKKAASKSAKKPAAMKPVTQALSKSGLVSHISQHTGVDTKSTRAVLEALEQTMHSAVSKKGAGLFTNVKPGFDGPVNVFGLAVDVVF